MELEELGIREECGVFGCIASGAWPTQLDVPHVITLGLVGLQHRGQESAGIVTSDGGAEPTYKAHKGMGLVNHVFNEESLKKLNMSNLGIGHTRYSTSGNSALENCQPFVVETLHGKIAVAHNGELVNAARLKRKLMRHGIGLSTSSDSELITQLLAFTPPMEEDHAADWVARIKNLMNETPTSYSLLIMHNGVIYAVRDPYGNRPLCIGRLIPVTSEEREKNRSDTEGWVVSSESCSFLSIAVAAQLCGIQYVEVLCKNRYVGRTFIQPNVRLRQLGVAKKFGVLSDNFAGKRIVLIDDSIVRGNTISPIIKLLKDSGAKEVHIRVASPPIRYPCYMGINIPTKEELIANRPEFNDLAGYIGANSVVYLSVEGLTSAVREGIKHFKDQPNGLNGTNTHPTSHGHCTACLTGEYPVELEW
ncbi:hypothetical protein GDO78_016293 [Eleutherodactylus coqui]|uniref:Amidophosphoribosyltransferase n=1 Tax=Eleutherodactylus coqui TaxID=57060 RepID=A0A8J6JW30_ELECQ|nr:hypothetical protein GDO78_016293 [Eleutherodactylus coqui]